MTQWWGAGQPVAPRRTATSANDINAGRIHFDCGTAMITRMTLLFIFITVSFLCLVWFVVSANVVFTNSFLATVARLLGAPFTELFFGQFGNCDDQQDHH